MRDIRLCTQIRNASHSLDRWWSALLKLNYPKDHIILDIIEDFSEDDTYRKLKQFQRDSPFRDFTIKYPTDFPSWFKLRAPHRQGSSLWCFQEWLCFADGEHWIYTNPRPSKLSTLESRKVLNKDGDSISIIDVGKMSYVGNMFKVKPAYFDELRVTPNHRLLVSKCHRNWKGKRIFSDLCWVRADEIIPWGGMNGHFLFVPRTKEFKYEQMIFDKEGGGSRRFGKTIVLDEDMAWMIGMWVAEGYFNEIREHELAQVCFSLNTLETDFEQRIRIILRNKFNLRTSKSVNKLGDGMRIRACSQVLARWLLTNCGRGANNKMIPPQVFTSPISVKMAFIKGVADGDGCVWGNQIRITTTSNTLAHHLQFLLSGLGHMACASQTTHLTPKGERKPDYRVCYALNPKNQTVVPYKNGWLVPIRSSSSYPFNGLITTLGTSDGTFLMPFVSHNSWYNEYWFPSCVKNDTPFFCVHCFADKNHWVYTYPVPSKISSLGVDTILNKDGKSTNIKKIDEFPYSGDIVYMKPAYFSEVRVTPHHKFLVAHAHKTNGKPWIKLTDPQWKEARDLQEYRYGKTDIGDYLFVPLVNDGHQVTMPIGTRNIFVSEDISWLIGMYVAEGSIWNSNHENYGIRFTLSEKEADKALRIKEILSSSFNVSARLVPIPRYHVLSIELKNYELAKWFGDNCGQGAENKRIPGIIFESYPLIRQAFIDGYVSGDGHKYPLRHDRVIVATVSETLAYHLQFMLAGLGFMAGIFRDKNRPQIFKSKECNVRDIYRIYWMTRSSGGRFIKGEGGTYIPIKTVKTIKFSGTVTNVRTNDGTFMMPFVSHNSDAICHPETLNRHLKIMDERKDCGWVGSLGMARGGATSVTWGWRTYQYPLSSIERSIMIYDERVKATPKDALFIAGNIGRSLRYDELPKQEVFECAMTASCWSIRPEVLKLGCQMTKWGEEAALGMSIEMAKLGYYCYVDRLTPFVHINGDGSEERINGRFPPIPIVKAPSKQIEVIKPVKPTPPILEGLDAMVTSPNLWVQQCRLCNTINSGDPKLGLIVSFWKAHYRDKHRDSPVTYTLR